MSTRTNMRPQVVLKAGDMTGDLTSDATVLQSLTMVSYAVSWTGSSPIGELSLQLSDDYSLDPNGLVNNPGTWNSAPLSVGGSTTSTIPITGNSGNGYIDVLGTAAYAARLIYMATSGTGSLTITVVGKVG